MLDREYAKEVRKANGGGSREAKFISAALIEDNLHPSRIEEYAGGFVRATTE